MSKRYGIVHLFENINTIIIEVNRIDMPDTKDTLLVNHWLFYDKISKAMVKLWLRSVDSSSEINERYFEQGYLKFDGNDATYIEKFNSAQHKLSKKAEAHLNEELTALINGYFFKM